MQQEVVLALLAKEPSRGSQLRARLDDILGPLADGINAGQVYVTLGRLERAGYVRREGRSGRPEAKVYALTAAGHEWVSEWLNEVDWPKPDLIEFHMKLAAAAQARLADPVNLVDAQRRELLRRLRDVERAAMGEEPGSDAGLLLEGIALRLQADLRWLEACERALADRKGTR